jgi:hypothetical protein
MSNAAFKRNFARLLARVGDKADIVVRKTALELQASMVLKSPVDTGRFRGNWQCGIGGVDTGTASGEDKTGAGSIGRTTTALAGWRPGLTIWLTNSLPYSRRLEHGWSRQAPQGMVKLTVVEYGQHLRRAVGALR